MLHPEAVAQDLVVQAAVSSLVIPHSASAPCPRSDQNTPVMLSLCRTAPLLIPLSPTTPTTLLCFVSFCLKQHLNSAPTSTGVIVAASVGAGPGEAAQAQP